MEDIKVSIVCNTYNQESYIEDALKGFLAQKTTFAYEVLVHDDASTDRTAEVVARYAELYPDIVKPLYEEVNQYTLGEPHNFAVQSARVQGDYVALCEGDDYWCDPNKLQLQYEALEAHPELDICVHAAKMVRADTKRTVKLVRPREQDCVIPVEDVISGGGGFVMTNSIFMRAETFVHPPKILREFNLDFMVQIFGSMRGGMYYIDRCMSAYRVAAVGSHTRAELGSNARTASNLRRTADALRELDAQTGYVYSRPLANYIDRIELSYYTHTGNLDDAFHTQTWKAKPILEKLSSLPFMLYTALVCRIEKARVQ